jgi:hypothetical protein
MRLFAGVFFSSIFACTVAASAATLTGVVVDARTGRPLAGLAIAASSYDGDFRGSMAGDAPPATLPPGASTVTGPDGSYVVTVDGTSPWVMLDVYGAPRGFATYHGIFAATTTRVPLLRLVAPNAAERHALAQINAFRRAPGGNASYGIAQPLIFDQNLVLAARYWAGQQMRAHRIGHTCAALGNPVGCIEFNAYFHALPGAPPFDDAGQNAAFDTDPSWTQPDQLFEAEGNLCGYNWHACEGGRDGSASQTGHYVNLMIARRWAGFGEAAAAGDGSYFALNLL